MLAAYQKRVSFDSINPNKESDPDNPPHIPPQYEQSLSHTAVQQTTRRGLDLNLGYDTYTPKADVLKVFDSFNQLSYAPKSQASYTYSSYKKKNKVPKLPPAPSKSILKHNYNSEDDASTPRSSNSVAAAAAIVAGNRKKSLVDMTPDEILALDAQFRKGVNLDQLKFDGDGYLPFQTFDNIENKKMTRQIQKIDKMIGSLNNKSKNSIDDLNFSSYSSSYRHDGLKKFVEDELSASGINNSSWKDTNGKDCLREVMIYISGRRHTWDSINWSFKKFLKDGDHVIIVCRVPKFSDDNNNDCAVYDDVNDDEEEEELEDIKESVENLRQYVFKVIELLNLKDLKIAITLEFIKENSVGNLLKQVVKFYEPHVFIVSALLTYFNLTIQRKHYRIPTFVMKNLNVPVITIPNLLIDEELVRLKNYGINNPKNIPILIETDHDADVFNRDFDRNSDGYLNQLNKISDGIDKTTDDVPIEVYTMRTHSRRSSTTNSTNTSGSTSYTSKNIERAVSPQTYYPATTSGGDNYMTVPATSIKFSDDLKIPRSGSSSTSRRSSNNNTHNIYKVKSLLDDDFPIERTKSLSNSISMSGKSPFDATIRRKSSGGGASIKKSISAGTTAGKSDKDKERRGSSSLWGLFKKKK